MDVASRTIRSILVLPENGLTPKLQARARRVLLLTGLVLMLSAGDLLTTLIFLQSTGMEEANPVAAFVMSSGSIWSLIVFKAGSVFTSLSVIWLLRHRWQGEIAAWIAAFILVALTYHWYVYTSQLAEVNSTFVLSHAQGHANWHILSR